MSTENKGTIQFKISVNEKGTGTLAINGQQLLGVRVVNVRATGTHPLEVTLQLIGWVDVEAEASEINAELTHAVLVGKPVGR